MRRAWACFGTVVVWLFACEGDPGSGEGGGGAPATTTTASTSGPGGPGASTSSSSSGAGGAGGEAPALDPVFVAIGAGAWSATSCDRGQTWSTQELSADRDDHSEWAAFGGLAFGNGAFVMGTGWGYPGHVIRSVDAMTWVDLPDAAFPDGGFDSSIGGVAFDGAQHLLFGSEIWASPDGATWTVTGRSLPPGSNQLRQLRAFPSGLIVASVETQYGNDHALGNWVTVSTDGGQSWTEGTGYDPDCSSPIQHWGDIHLSNGVLLVGADALCRSTDLGATWSVGALPGQGAVRDIFSDGTDFYATSGSRLYRSPDGADWEESADLSTEVAHGAWGDGTYVVMSGDGARVFSSADGMTFEEGTVTTALGPAVVRDLAVGYLPDACP